MGAADPASGAGALISFSGVSALQMGHTLGSSPEEKTSSS